MRESCIYTYMLLFTVIYRLLWRLGDPEMPLHCIFVTMCFGYFFYYSLLTVRGFKVWSLYSLVENREGTLWHVIFINQGNKKLGVPRKKLTNSKNVSAKKETKSLSYIDFIETARSTNNCTQGYFVKKKSYNFFSFLLNVK